MTYELTKRDGQDVAIRCLLCGAESENGVDILQRYCWSCTRYHEDATALASIAFRRGIQDLRPDLDAAGRALALVRVLEALHPANVPPRSLQPQWSAEFMER